MTEGRDITPKVAVLEAQRGVLDAEKLRKHLISTSDYGDASQIGIVGGYLMEIEKYLAETKKTAQDAYDLEQRGGRE